MSDPPTYGPPPPPPPSVAPENVVVLGGTSAASLTAAMLHERAVCVTLVEPDPSRDTYDPTSQPPLLLTARSLPFLRSFPALYDQIIREGAVVASKRVAVIRSDGSVVRADSPFPPKLEAPVAISAATLAEIAAHHAASLPLVTRVYADLTDVRRAADGALQLKLTSPDGTTQCLSTHLVIVADGHPSRALAKLRDQPWLSSRRGLRDKHFRSTTDPDLRYRGIVLDSSIDAHVETLATKSATKSPSTKPVSLDTALQLIAPPLRGLAPWVSEAGVSRCGGRPMTIVAPSSSPVMRAQTPEELAQALDASWPSLMLSSFVAPSVFADTAARRSKPLTNLRRVRSLTARVAGDGRGACEAESGIILLGDAAHTEPAELMLPGNTAFSDVCALADVLDKMPSTDRGVHALLRSYEQCRDSETNAMMCVMQHAFPPAGSHRFVSLFWRVSNRLRSRLSSKAPLAFDPPDAQLVAAGTPLCEVRYMSQRTRRRMFAVVFWLPLAVGLGIVKALRQGRVDRDDAL